MTTQVGNRAVHHDVVARARACARVGVMVGVTACVVVALLASVVAPAPASAQPAGGSTPQTGDVSPAPGDDVVNAPNGGPNGDPANNSDSDEPAEVIAPADAIRPAARDAIKRLDDTAAAVELLKVRAGELDDQIARQRQVVEQLTQTSLARAADRVQRGTDTLADLQRRRDEAIEVREKLRVQARAVALGMYLAGPVDHLDFGVVTNHPDALDRLWSTETVRYGVGAAHASLRRQSDRIDRLTEAAQRRQAALDDDRGMLAEVTGQVEAEQAELARLEDRRQGVELAQQRRQAETVVAQGEVVALLALAELPALPAANPGLSVLGPSVLDADALAAWFVDHSGAFAVDPTIARLAALYVDEGNQLGVRGDVAFMQAVLETGGFRFTGSHNYAGVGHCDSCPRGYAFASERDGVRAQLQLLRGYADRNVTPDDLPGGPVAPINVSSLGVRGCCTTWWGLSGVWASALHYGGSILALYESALDHAAARAAAAAELTPGD